MAAVPTVAALLSAAAILAVALAASSCVSVTDLRDDESALDVPTGQVDTGWKPDSEGPDLPPPIACERNTDCSDWLGDTECQVAACSDGVCAARPAADGLPCSDGASATRGDRCAQGRCIPGPDVCLCGVDADCAPFDDLVACDGRLACDGCGCVPVETPIGTPCDDGDPATVADVCISSTTCRGKTPCLCSSDADCPAATCSVAVCADCTCRSFSDAPGTVYATGDSTPADSSTADSSTADSSTAVPAGWTVASTNPLIAWRGSAASGVRATGADGSYDHGATITTLTSPAVPLPAGAAILELRIGLLSAEASCDDRLEVRSGDVLLDTLCGPTAVERHIYPLSSPSTGSLTLTFVTNDLDNAGAGAVFEGAVWRRVAPSACGGNDVETAVPNTAGRTEMQPDVAVSSVGGWIASWEDEEGIWVRSITAAVVPTGDAVLIDAGGRHAAVAFGWLAWEHGAGVRLRPIEGTSSAEYTLPAAQWPDLDAAANGSLPVIAVRTPTGAAELRTPSGDILMAVADPLFAGRATITAGGTLVVATPTGVLAATANAVTPFIGPAAIGRPDAAVGMARIAAAWPSVDGVAVATDKGESLQIGAIGAADVALEATTSGWVVVWVDAETHLLAASLLTGTLSASVPYAAISTYGGFAASPRLAPDSDGVLAIWEAPWLDGDAHTVVIRALPNPLLGL